MLERNTVFSPCRKYRYSLWREWDSQPPQDFFIEQPKQFGTHDQYLQIIGLNPSTADETSNDPTIVRCIDFAQRWGFGAFCMTNLFAWRDTLPVEMKKEQNPIGDDNDHWLKKISAGAGMILAGWGNHGIHLGRCAEVLKLIEKPVHCLYINETGQPKHPLFVDGRLLPFVYTPR